MILDSDESETIETTPNSSFEPEVLNKIKNSNIPLVNNNPQISRFADRLNSLVVQSASSIPESFHSILNNLISKIIEPASSIDDDFGFNDFTTVFKPGLFTNAVLEQYPLILKDLPNLAPAVFERFNQLNSCNPCLILNEDICNTFTTNDSRLMNHFTEGFRIISISSEDARKNLSEAALSRITTIHVTKYSKKESNCALVSICASLFNNDTSPALFLEKFCQGYYLEFKKELSFPILSKILCFLSKLKSSNTLNPKNNVGIAIYRILGGSLKTEDKKLKIIDIIQRIGNDSICDFHKKLITDELDHSTPFKMIHHSNVDVITSEISSVYIPLPKVDKSNLNIEFVPPFIDLLDVLFTGLAVHYPVVLEGSSGKGKHSAIQYIADILGYNIIKFGVSSATTAEDIFCKTIPIRQEGKLEFVLTPSQILTEVNSDTSNDKNIILLEDLNQASPALLDAISPLFDSTKNTVLLPNGDIIKKGNYNLIAFYDPSSQTAVGNSLPFSIKLNSLYHSILNYTKKQIIDIATKMFSCETNAIKKEQSKFLSQFFKMGMISPKMVVPEFFTLNDIKKFILFRRQTSHILDYSTTSEMVLLYRFSENRDFEKAADELNVDVNEFWPNFSIESDSFCAFSANNTITKLKCLVNPGKIHKSKKYIKKLHSLSLSQRYCLIFLMCSVLSKQASIVQGPTSSGKTYIIRLFAKIMNKKLVTIQINGDTGISTLTGQFAPSVSLSEEDIIIIGDCFKEINKFPEYKTKLNEILNINDPETWSPSKLKNVEQIISSSHKEELSHVINTLHSKQSFLSHLRQQDSAFIQAIRNGSWILLDGIESASKELFEKIAPLCSSEPILNLYERGPDCIYSRKNKGEYQIHEDFQLFITYNPNDIEPNRKLSHSIMNKFVTFVLQPIDSTEKMSAIVLHGLLSNFINNELAIELSSRLANVHNFAKDYSIRNPTKFVAFNQFTGRSLVFNYNIIKRYFINNEQMNNDNSASILIKCLINNYINSHKEPTDFYWELVGKLLKEPELDIVQAIKRNCDKSNEQYKNILIDLYELQKNKIESNFSIQSFCKKAGLFLYKDVDQLCFHVCDTLNMLRTPQEINNFGILNIMRKILNYLINRINLPKPKISSTFLECSIVDKEPLRDSRSALALSKLHLFNTLLELSLISLKTPLCLYHRDSLDVILELNDSLKKSTFCDILNIIKKMIMNQYFQNDCIDLLNNFYFSRSNYNKALKIIPVLIDVYQLQIPFEINKEKYDFPHSSCKYFIKFDLSQRDFTLTNESKIIESENNNAIDIPLIRFIPAVNYIILCTKNNVTPIFPFDFPQTHVNLEVCHPLLKLFNEDSILKCIITTAIHFEEIKKSDLSFVFGQFESDLIKLFNNIWQIYIHNDLYISKAIKLIDFLNSLIDKFPLIIDVINQDIEFLKKKYIDLDKLNENIQDVKEKLNNYNDLEFATPNNSFKQVIKVDFKDYFNKWVEILDVKQSEILIDHLKVKNSREYNELNQEKKNLKNKILTAMKVASNDDVIIYKQINHFIDRIEILPQNIRQARTNLEAAKLNIERMIDIIQKPKIYDNSRIIPFPSIQEHSYQLNHKHIKLCSVFIKYSMILNYISNIEDNRDPMMALHELSQFKDLADPYSQLAQYLCVNSNETDDSKKNSLLSNFKNYASAKTIIELIAIDKDYLIKPNKINQEFDEFSLRKDLDVHLLSWASKLTIEYDPDFVIQFPHYSPADILLLFVNVKAKPEAGFLFNKIVRPNKKLFSSFSEINPNDYDKMTDLLNEIARISFEILLNKIILENYEEEIQKVTQKNDKSSDLEIFNGIKLMFEICKQQDSKEPYKFEKDDLFFININWIKDKKNCLKYPSLTYWLIDQPDCQKQLRFYFDKITNKDDQLPLYLHIIRIFSTMSCIKFKVQNESDVAKELSNIVDKALLLFLKDNNPNNLNWLNLVLPNVPIEFYDPDCALMFSFINSLCSDSQRLNSLLSKEYRKKYLGKMLNKIIESIFDGTIHSYIVNDSPNDLNSFIKDPHSELCNYINRKYSKIKRKSYEEISNKLKPIERPTIILRDTKKKLIESIEKDLIFAKTLIINDELERNYNKLSESIKEFESSVHSYNTIFQNIKKGDSYDDDTIANNEIKKLLYLKKVFNDINIFSKETLYAIKCYGVEQESYEVRAYEKNPENGFKPDINKERKENEKDSEIVNKKYIKIPGSPYRKNDFMINPNYYNVLYQESHPPDLVFRKVTTNNKEIHKISPKISVYIFYPLSEILLEKKRKDFENQIAQSTKSIKMKEMNPRMSFGLDNKINITNFPKIINQIYKITNKFMIFFDNSQESSNLFKVAKGKINEITEKIIRVYPISSAKIVELDRKADETTSIINVDIKPNIECLHHYIKVIKEEIYKIADEELKIENDIKDRLFLHEYQVPNFGSKENPKSILIPFNKLDQHNFATPFITLTSSHEIGCCVPRLDCLIGPFIPDLYESKQFSIKILSFISQLLNSRIDMESDQQLFSTIPTSHQFSPITILVSLPEYKKDIPIEHTINGELIISSTDIKQFTLPVKFTFQLLPLNVVIRTEKYNLSFSDEIFHIEQNNFNEGEKIYINIEIPQCKEKLSFSFSKKSLLGNDANEPFCEFTEEKLCIHIPEQPSHIHGIIYLNITNKLSIPFELDGEIKTFNYTFQIYDRINNKFEENEIKVYNISTIQQKFYCYVEMDSPKEKNDIKIYAQYSNSLCISNDEPIFISPCCFYFEIEIKAKETMYMSSSRFGIEISNIQKNITIIPINDELTIITAKGFIMSFNNYYVFSQTELPYYVYSYKRKSFLNIKYNDVEIKECCFQNHPIVAFNQFKVSILNPPNTTKNAFQINYNELKSYTSSCNKFDQLEFLYIDKFNCKNIQKTSNINYISYIILIGQFVEGWGRFNRQIVEWFPFCDNYVPTCRLLDTSNEHMVTFANKNIINFIRKLCEGIFDIPSDDLEITYEAIINKKEITRTNFALIAVLLATDRIDPDSGYLPKDINDLFMKYAPKKDTVKSKRIIFWHNTIMELHNQFKEKYNSFKERNFYLFLPFEWNDIISYQKAYFSDYNNQSIDKFLSTISINPTKKKFEKIIFNRESPSIKSKKWLIQPNSKPKHNFTFNPEEEIQYFSQKNTDLEFKGSDLININEALKTPSFSEIHTIDETNNLLMTLINTAQSLPYFIYVFKKDKEVQKEIQNSFNKLLFTYKICSASKMSILRPKIISFMNSFEHLCARFQQSGISFEGWGKDFLETIRGKQNIQNYIIYPDPINAPMSNNQWYIENKNQLSHSRRSLCNMLIDNNEDSHLSINIEQQKKNVPEKNDIKPEPISHTTIAEEVDAEISMIPIIDTNDELLGTRKESKNIKCISNKMLGDDSVMHEIKGESLKSIIKDFKGEKMIQGIIERIKAMKTKGKLLLPNLFPQKPSDKISLKYLKDDQKTLPIRKLVALTEHSSARFIKEGIDKACFNKFSLQNSCGIILIECSQTLSEDNKIACIFLAISMANAFAAIEIPYSIIVFADYNFQFIIKKFDEPHSDDILQKIYDCTMVERWAPRIADACYYAKINSICTNRTNRAIFVISDGLDPSLNYFDDWKMHILNNKNDSFGFYFLRSKYLDNESSYEVVKEMWTKFSIGVNTANSLTRYYEVSTDSILTSSDSRIYELFGSILEPLTNSLCDPLSTEFKEPILFDGNIHESALSHTIEFISSYYNDSVDDIFLQNDEPDQSTGIRFPSFQLSSNFLAKSKNELNQDEINRINQNIIFHRQPLNSQWKEVIFAPNKPSQMSPSAKGTRLYIQGLIKFCLTDGQENKIWYEKNAGLKRNYRVTVVIDTSFSCFNEIMYIHSLQTVVTFLRTLANIEIPYFDLIIATAEGPEVLAVNQNSQSCLDPHASDIWTALFSAFERNQGQCNLADAIRCAFKLKSSIVAKKSYMFVFTDGLFDPVESCSLKTLIHSSRDFSISTYGIGIGLYPAGIKNLFNKCIWASNPIHIITALSGFFGNEIQNKLENIKLFSPVLPDVVDLKNVLKELVKKKNDLFVYKGLVKDLREKALFSESMPDFQHEVDGIEGLASNPGFSDNTTMYCKNAFHSQKILVCAFWSKSIAGKDENDYVNPIYLTQRYDPKKECVGDILSYYGIGIDVVLNYKDAILNLQTGKYYAAWVICGAGTGKLPDPKGNANLVGQFIECIDTFWKGGGAIVWWCDNDPLFYELNLFLEQAEFPGHGKIGLRMSKGSDGLQYIKAGNIDSTKSSVFSNQRENDCRLYVRPTVAHNLVSLFEGYTISQANNVANVGPFKPFAFDSKGGLFSMVFMTDYESSRGDMVIDGGFTKLFYELNFSANDGTLRYVQNIAAFTAQYEKRMRDLGEDGPRSFRPVTFKYTINESAKWDKFINDASGPFDIVYMVDSTGSMGGTIKAAQDQCINISNELKRNLPDFEFQFGGIFYRDPIDSPSDKHDTFLLTSDIPRLQSQIVTVRASGGGDGPEDWVGAYKIALDNMNWRRGVKLIIHIADAPAHGSYYCGTSNHEEETSKLEPLIRRCANQDIKIIGMPIKDCSRLSYERCQTIYNSSSSGKASNLYKIQPFGSSDISSHFKNLIVNAAICAAPVRK